MELSSNSYLALIYLLLSSYDHYYATIMHVNKISCIDLLILIFLALLINKEPMKNKAKSTNKGSLSIASLNPNAHALKLLNPKREPLTPSALKSFASYEHLTDKEAEEKCDSIQSFARLLLAHLRAVKNTNIIDNQHVISLDSGLGGKIVPITQGNKKGKAA